MAEIKYYTVHPLYEILFRVVRFEVVNNGIVHRDAGSKLCSERAETSSSLSTASSYNYVPSVFSLLKHFELIENLTAITTTISRKFFQAPTYRFVKVANAQNHYFAEKNNNFFDHNIGHIDSHRR